MKKKKGTRSSGGSIEIDGNCPEDRWNQSCSSTSLSRIQIWLIQSQGRRKDDHVEESAVSLLAKHICTSAVNITSASYGSTRLVKRMSLDGSFARIIGQVTGVMLSTTEFKWYVLPCCCASVNSDTCLCSYSLNCALSNSLSLQYCIQVLSYGSKSTTTWLQVDDDGKDTVSMYEIIVSTHKNLKNNDDNGTLSKAPVASGANSNMK